MISQPCTATAAYSYGALALQFTGKERDAETGLDCFVARQIGAVPGWITSSGLLMAQRQARATHRR